MNVNKTLIAEIEKVYQKEGKKTELLDARLKRVEQELDKLEKPDSIVKQSPLDEISIELHEIQRLLKIARRRHKRIEQKFEKLLMEKYVKSPKI